MTTHNKSEACDGFVTLVPAYLGGAPFEGRGAFVAHIARCESCRRELLETARLAKELAAVFDGVGAGVSSGTGAPDYPQVFAAIVGCLSGGQELARQAARVEPVFSGPAELAIASALMRGIAGTIRGARVISSPGYWARLGRMAAMSVSSNG